MALSNRTTLYQQVRTDDTVEFDYIRSSLNEMELTTTDSITLNSVYAFRPDLLSYKFYGNFDFGWLIAYHNDIVDPLTEFTVGRKINIPSMEDYYRYVNRNKKKGIIDG